MYKLKKLNIEEGKTSLLPEGYVTRGHSLKLLDYETNAIGGIENITDILVGWQVLLEGLGDYHRTSKIKEIVSKDKDSVIFKTQTSTYKLTQL